MLQNYIVWLSINLKPIDIVKTQVVLKVNELAAPDYFICHQYKFYLQVELNPQVIKFILFIELSPHIIMFCE